jgi:hypothetical protein
VGASRTQRIDQARTAGRPTPVVAGRHRSAGSKAGREPSRMCLAFSWLGLDTGSRSSSRHRPRCECRGFASRRLFRLARPSGRSRRRSRSTPRRDGLAPRHVPCRFASAGAQDATSFSPAARTSRAVMQAFASFAPPMRARLCLSANTVTVRLLGRASREALPRGVRRPPRGLQARTARAAPASIAK